MPFEKNITVAQYECDLNNHMSIGSIMRQVQQISTDHCDSKGAVIEVFNAHNVAFLLAKLSVEIGENITYSDKIRLVTSPTAPQKATFHRFTTGFRNGTPVFTVDARWILVDKTSKKILRTAPDGIFLPFDDGAPQTHNIRINKAETVPCGEMKASYSRLDINKHMNNTQYADCICDALPLEEMASRQICKLVIYYHHELPLGATATIGTAKIDGDTYYICGENCGIKYFEAQVTFKPAPQS